MPQRPFPALGRRGLLVVGLCFGLAYGLTQRVLSLDWGDWRPLSHPFDVKGNPGTSLEKLRQRYGQSGRSIRGDLEMQELEKANREAAVRRRHEQDEQERRLRAEDERLERAQELPPPAASADVAPPTLAPAAPTLPSAPSAPPAASTPAAPEAPAEPPPPPAPQP